jgi:hypothetical protein
MTANVPKPQALNIPSEECVRCRMPRFVAMALAMVLIGVVVLFAAVRQSGPITSVSLADSRVLQIEGVTYGTEHRIGQPSSFVLEHLSPWLPKRIRRFFEPKYPTSSIHLDRPGLVVWVNALDPLTGKHMDCQGIRVEFVDKNGDLLAQDTSSWFGGQSFWRVGHIFYSFPRDEKQLMLRVTPWGNNATSTARFSNPHFVPAAKWSGDQLPQTRVIGDTEIVLSSLVVQTNGGAKKFWETPAKYWEPVWEFRQNGKPTDGWETPEWIAEDATGNRGQFLGVHQPALRYFAKVYPRVTNTNAGTIIASLPQEDLAHLNTNIWWNKRYSVGTNDIVVLGLCAPGVYSFSEGKYDTNGPKVVPTQGGAPSGWVGTSKRVTPLRVQEWHSHYTPSPTIYVRASGLHEPNRLAVRLRDNQGRYWAAKPEPQGSADGIRPFLVEVPTEVTNIVPEIALLNPVRAEFSVDTKKYIAP